MIVRCPSCKTTYKVADELVKDTKPAFRCSRCKHTFELESAETPERTVDSAHAAASLFSKSQQERELSFTFAPKKQEDGENRKESIPSPRDDFEFPAGSAEDQSMGNVESTVDEPLTSPEPDPGIGADQTPIFHLSCRRPNHFHWLGKQQITFCLLTPTVISPLPLCLF